MPASATPAAARSRTASSLFWFSFQVPSTRLTCILNGTIIRSKITGDRDPGYGSTAKMLGEAATTLLSRDSVDVGGGFWTPATALGDDYVDALQAHAGVRFEVL